MNNAQKFAAVIALAASATTGVIVSSEDRYDLSGVPCYGDTCVACLEPVWTQCEALTNEDFAGKSEEAALAVWLQEATAQGLILQADTKAIEGNGARIVSCFTQIFMTRAQREVWGTYVDANAENSQVIDCRLEALPAHAKTAQGGRLTALAGMPTGGEPGDAAKETFPEVK